MNISSAQYVEDENGNKYAISATIDGKDTGVPIAPGNRHYDEIMKQIEAGDLTIADAD